MQTTAWWYMGINNKQQTSNDMNIQYLFYIHTHTHTSEHHSQTTENPKLYNTSAIRTVAQNTIMIYSNTFFFFYDKQVRTVHTKRKHKPSKATKVHVIRSVGSHAKKGAAGRFRGLTAPLAPPSQCPARLIISGGKSGGDINYAHNFIIQDCRCTQHTFLNVAQWKWTISHARTRNRAMMELDRPPTPTFPHTVTLYSDSGTTLVDTSILEHLGTYFTYQGEDTELLCCCLFNHSKPRPCANRNLSCYTFLVMTGNLQQWLLRRITPSHQATEGYGD